MDYRIQTSSINASRALYALNWFNIAPGLSYIAHDFNIEIVQLGAMTTAFYVGLALFQMVGGLLASKIGNRNTAIFGIMVLGAAVMFTGLSQNLVELISSRFFAGLGSAFFFSPALGLVSEIVPQEKYAFHVGLFNGSFNLGGGIGVIGWSFLDSAYGWRSPLIMAGALLIAVAIENWFVLRGVNPLNSSMNIGKRAWKVFKNREIWIFSIVAISAILSETIIGNLFVYYTEKYLHYGSPEASSLGSIFLLIGFVGGILGGYVFGKTRRKFISFLIVSVIVAVMTAMIPLSGSYYYLLALMILLGIFTVNGFSMLYSLIVLRTTDRGMVSFSLSIVNFIQNIIGSATPFFFGVMSHYYGYPISWETIGIIGIFCTFLIIPVRIEFWKERRNGGIATQ
ncbi:MAG: MFS transporter [Candidatus Thermoplasmatota archaeon]|nr:MFS transporter [Candidatus Thermoplasmatota archaeon]